MEIWKDIPGYEGSYQVSSRGRIKSLSRIMYRRGKYPFQSKEKYMALCVSSTGYYIASVRKDGKVKNMKAHIAVAMAFLGYIPNGKYDIVVDHIDNDKLNNNLSNLQLITQRLNSSKDQKPGTSKYAGVHYCKRAKKYQARIMISGTRYSLGYYENDLDAMKAYTKRLQTL